MSSPSAESCGGPGVVVQVLGSGGPEFVPDRAGSSALIWINGKARVLIDTGSGSSLRFAKSGAGFSDLDIVLWTRLHADHTAGIPALIQASRSESRTRPLPIYGPVGGRGMPSTIGFVRDLFDNTRGTFRHLGEFISPLDKSTFKLEPHDVRPPKPQLGTRRAQPAGPMRVFSNERFQVTATNTSYESVPAVAFRIDIGGKSIVVGADGDGPGVAEMASQASLILSAHSVAEGSKPSAANGYYQPSQIGQFAKLVEARQLVLTHRGRATLGKEDATLATIRRYYNGPVEFADDLGCYRP